MVVVLLLLMILIVGVVAVIEETPTLTRRDVVSPARRDVATVVSLRDRRRVRPQWHDLRLRKDAAADQRWPGNGIGGP